jgi:hypothetical protein
LLTKLQAIKNQSIDKINKFLNTHFSTFSETLKSMYVSNCPQINKNLDFEIWRWDALKSITTLAQINHSSLEGLSINHQQLKHFSSVNLSIYFKFMWSIKRSFVFSFLLVISNIASVFLTSDCLSTKHLLTSNWD